MSLKAFHIAFVTISTILCAGVGLWAWRSWRVEGDYGLLVGSICSFAGCVALIIYGRWFLRKLRGVSYL